MVGFPHRFPSGLPAEEEEHDDSQQYGCTCSDTDEEYQIVASVIITIIRNIRWRFYVHDGEVGQPVSGEDDVLSVILALFDIVGSVTPDVPAWKNSTTYRNI